MSEQRAMWTDLPCNHVSTVGMTIDFITEDKAVWRCNRCRELFSFARSTAAHLIGASETKSVPAPSAACLCGDGDAAHVVCPKHPTAGEKSYRMTLIDLSRR